MIRRTVTVLVFIGSFIVSLAFIPSSAAAYSPDQFVQALRTKFRTTSNIYLEAISTGSLRGRSIKSDTSRLLIAYRYPDRFLQSLVGTNGRRQNFILKNDSYVLTYPHLDFERRRKLSRGSILQLLKNHVPIAGVLLGIRQGDLPKDKISTKLSDGIITVTVTNDNPRLPFRKFTGSFQRDGLIPKTMYIEGEKQFKITVTEYREEERFPEFVENAFIEMDPSYLRRFSP